MSEKKCGEKNKTEERITKLVIKKIKKRRGKNYGANDDESDGGVEKYEGLKWQKKKIKG